jgi:desulfoferrodoxin (superoxide reductase-like protein)
MNVSRRAVVRSIPLLGLLGAVLGIGCVVDHPDYLTERKRKQPGPPGEPPADDDEFVARDDSLTPINGGDTPPQVPNMSWEARASQLEANQQRLYGAVFTSDAATNRMMSGKERSHVPKLTFAIGAGDVKRVTVLVEHVMGGNVDAGASADAGADARADGAADASDAAVLSDGSADAAASVAATATSPAVEHYVTTIFLRGIIDGKETVVGLWELSSTDGAPPSVTFTLPAGLTNVVAYESCTLHGLWKSEPLPV